MPFRADCLPRLLDALRTRDVPRRTLELFAQHWRAVPADSRDFPCPFCFAGGRLGSLAEQTEVGGIAAMRCGTCGEQLLVRTE